jgi:diaminopimelate epimerase
MPPASASSPIGFYKLSGAGNDFIALAEPERDPTAEQIAAWCRRGISLGADGVFVLRRTTGPSATPRVDMVHFNADGGRAELCFNGARCAARLAFHLGWAQRRVEVATEAGVFSAEPSLDTGSVRIEAPVPTAAPARLSLSIGGSEIEAWRLVVGVPHLVVIGATPVAELDLPRLGPPLRRHPALGPLGANVNFVAFPDRGVLEVRTWERGVEGETLACGSGIIASALVGLMLGTVSLPLEIRSTGGKPIRLEGRVEGGRPVAWRLEGDARVVAEGRLLTESV